MPDKPKPATPQLPPGLRVIAQPGEAPPARPGSTPPAAVPAHAQRITKGTSWCFRGRHFATHEDAIEAKIAEHFRETHKSYIGVAEIAKWVRTHMDVLKQICSETPSAK